MKIFFVIRDIYETFKASKQNQKNVQLRISKMSKIFYEKNFKYYGSQLLSDTREILLYISKKIMDVRAFLENLNFWKSVEYTCIKI